MHTHTLMQIHAERYTMNVCTHVINAHVSVGMSQYRCMLLITQHTRSCLDFRVHSPLFAPHASPPASCKSVSLALALFPQALSTCRRHRHGRSVLLVPILILHTRVPTRSRSHKSDPVNACMRLSLAPIPSLLSCAKVRPARSRLRQARAEAQCGGAVRGARDCLRSVAPAAGHRAKNTPHAASGRSDATLALITSGRPTKNHLLQVRAFSARCDDQEGTHARARAGTHSATITAQ
jgi:hypothetical protein